MNDEDTMLAAALHALPSDEADAVERAIGADPRRRVELDELRAALLYLAEAEATPPPAALRARVLEAVEGVPQERPTTGSRPAAGAGDRAAGNRTRLSSIDGGREDAAPRVVHRRLRSRTLTLSAAAAMAALVAGVVAWFALGQTTGDDNEIAAVIDDPAAETVRLQSEVGGISVVFVPGGDDAVVVADGLPDPGDERTYQLWFLGGDAPVPSEVFRPGGDGDVELLVDDFDAEAGGYAVSTEPAGGSTEVTGEIIATSE